MTPPAAIEDNCFLATTSGWASCPSATNSTARTLRRSASTSMWSSTWPMWHFTCPDSIDRWVSPRRSWITSSNPLLSDASQPGRVPAQVLLCPRCPVDPLPGSLCQDADCPGGPQHLGAAASAPGPARPHSARTLQSLAAA